eukprot:TRINITY_DN15492_c0_g1_i1.p1 TRINITY_DN15492_c0_g1~~TRINITY_DN15492_c0_g1_i1.p1  ORF type:complete len:551 (+),score=104.49 TRINITY_DN15492_c0_g1_i1:84-1655(+)
MTSSRFATLFLLAWMICLLQAEFVAFSLTSKNYDKALTIQPHVAVRFEKTWCFDWCRPLRGVYEQAAKNLKKMNNDLVFFHVNASTHYELSNRYHIVDFPAIILHSHGKTYQYRGDHRSVQKIEDWVQKLVDPQASIPLLKDSRELFDRAESEKMLVAFVSEESEAQRFIYDAVVETRLKNFKLYEVSENRIAKLVGAKMNTLVSYLTDDPAHFDLNGADFKSLESWLSWESNDVVTEATQTHLEFIKGLGEPYAIFYIQDDLDKWLSSIKDWAQELYEELRVLYVDDPNKLNDFYNYGVVVKTYPALIVYNTTQKTPVVWNENKKLTKKEVVEWLKKSLIGKAPSYTRSVTPLNKNPSVIDVLGNNYSTVLYNQTKDLFLFLYSADCKRCHIVWYYFQKLIPLVGDKIILARMECDENANPGGELFTETPNLALIQPNTSTPIQFRQPSNLKNLYFFLVNHTSVSLSRNVTFADEDCEDEDSFDNTDVYSEKEEEKKENRSEDGDEDTNDELPFAEQFDLIY